MKYIMPYKKFNSEPINEIAVQNMEFYLSKFDNPKTIYKIIQKKSFSIKKLERVLEQSYIVLNNPIPDWWAIPFYNFINLSLIAYDYKILDNSIIDAQQIQNLLENIDKWQYKISRNADKKSCNSKISMCKIWASMSKISSHCFWENFPNNTKNKFINKSVKYLNSSFSLINSPSCRDDLISISSSRYHQHVLNY